MEDAGSEGAVFSAFLRLCIIFPRAPLCTNNISPEGDRRGLQDRVGL